MKDNYLVVKSNRFIMNSGYDLSLGEQKIILTLASMVSPDDEDFKPYIFKISEFINLLEINDPSKYSEIPKITKELMKKVFEIKEGKTTIQTAWLSSVKYEKGSGMVEMTFSNYLKPYMLQLNELYTQYRLKNVLSMKSKYSIRLYEILKSNEFKQQKNITISMDDLRYLFKVENTYQRYNDFKRNIIIYSQDELKMYSDISFEFEEIKTGRKVTAIKFYITKNSPVTIEDVKAQKESELSSTEEFRTKDDAEPMEKTIINNVRKIIKEPLTEYEAESLYNEANGNYNKLSDVYEYSKLMAETKTINNFVGYMISLLKTDFVKPETNKKTKKKDFDEREYDYDALERKLLGWE